MVVMHIKALYSMYACKNVYLYRYAFDFGFEMQINGKHYDAIL